MQNRYGFTCELFFFQAEDGIRDADVTGVQTCALPISRVTGMMELGPGAGGATEFLALRKTDAPAPPQPAAAQRSEERRVGKECRSRWSPDHQHKKNRANEIATHRMSSHTATGWCRQAL